METSPSTSDVIKPSLRVNPSHVDLEQLRSTITYAFRENETLETLTSKASNRIQKITRLSRIGNWIPLASIRNYYDKKLQDAQFEFDCLIDRKNKISIDMDTYFDENLEEKYVSVIKAFHELLATQEIMDVTYETQLDPKRKRTVATSAIQMHAVKFSYDNISIIHSAYPAFHLENKNGAALYLYPAFLITVSHEHEFTILPLTELRLVFTEVEMLMEEKIPADSKVVGHHWAKSNKDGSRDRRYAKNYQVPLVHQAEIKFVSESGLNETYILSNVSLAKNFVTVYEVYLDELHQGASKNLEENSRVSK